MKKKAFTLTELLVVVVIIGTLAAVIMPKFTRVLEARKTTEAENIMRAVRTEQEARCTLDKNYTARKDQLASYPKNEGNNYDYYLGSTGMSATSKSKNYTLEMLTYLDGGICCTGADCSSLNKNYPSCKDYADVAKANTECAAKDLPGPVPPPVVEECDNADEYTQGDTFTVQENGCTVTKKWTFSGYPTCTWNAEQVGDPECEETCTEGATQNVTSTCGTEKGQRCKNGAWVDYEQTVGRTEEEKKSCCCDDKNHARQTKPCENGTGEQYLDYYCDITDGNWKPGDWTECKEKVCQPTNEGQTRFSEPCAAPQVGSVWYAWDDQACVYDIADSTCKGDCKEAPNGIQTYGAYDCPYPQIGSGTIMSWNTTECQYEPIEKVCNKPSDNSDTCTWKKGTVRTETFQFHSSAGIATSYGQACKTAKERATRSAGVQCSVQEGDQGTGHNNGGSSCVSNIEASCTGNTINPPGSCSYDYGEKDNGYYRCTVTITYLVCQ